MSTANEPTTAQAQTTEAAEAPILDRVIEATQRRQSVVDNAAAIMGVEPTKLCDLLRNVWHTSKDELPLTDHEMFIGVSMVARYKLDPIAREVYVTRGKKGLMTVVGIDGWMKILHRTPYFDGFKRENTVDEDGNVTAITTTIYSKTHSHPFVYEALASEYKRVAGLVANILPIHMLGIFSLRHAARLFVPLSGVCMEEEAAFAERKTTPGPQSLKQLAAAGAPTPAPVQEEKPPEPETETEKPPDDADLYFEEACAMYRDTEFKAEHEIIRLDADVAKDDNLNDAQKRFILDTNNPESETSKARLALAKRLGGAS